MKRFEFDLTLTIDAASKAKAREIAANVLDNLKDTMGHSPHSCQLDLLESSGIEVKLVDEEDYDE